MILISILRQTSVLVLVALALLAVSCRRSAPPAVSDDVVELHIGTDGDFLAFDHPELTCPAGARVRLVFRHNGRRIPQEHNWVLVRPGSAAAVETAGMAAGESAGYVPRNDDRVLAAAPLCGPGGFSVVEFNAPPAGDYPFICTFPGHAAEMKGVLHCVAP